VVCEAAECRLTFLPLQESENPNAKNLPGLDYRRTLKLRLVFQSEPQLDSVEVFSGSRLKPSRSALNSARRVDALPLERWAARLQRCLEARQAVGSLSERLRGRFAFPPRDDRRAERPAAEFGDG